MKVNNPVAFSVGLSLQYSIGMTTVPFDVVHLNHGGGWNTGNHRFYPPVRGLYCLTVSIGTHQSVFVTVMVNNKSMFRAEQVQSSGSGGDAMTVMLMLEATGRVSIYLESGRVLDDHVCIDYNTFSGFLYADLS